MIDNTPAYPQDFPPVRLRVIRRERRPRELIDQKRTFLQVKRIIDVAFSVFFIVGVLSWLLPLLCLLIKLTSRGPALFVQQRVGFGGRSFRCYKLRTMVINNDADLLQATEHDERITRLGRFLRKSNMDEFPQFFNILLGDMSLVGPRPHMYADCRQFSSMLPGYKVRNMVKPGLTGLAQVKGFHGPATTYNCIAMRYEWDKHYISHLSAAIDFSIIVKTIWQKLNAVFHSAAEPFEKETIEEKALTN